MRLQDSSEDNSDDLRVFGFNDHLVPLDINMRTTDLAVKLGILGSRTFDPSFDPSECDQGILRSPSTHGQPRRLHDPRKMTHQRQLKLLLASETDHKHNGSTPPHGVSPCVGRRSSPVSPSVDDAQVSLSWAFRDMESHLTGGNRLAHGRTDRRRNAHRCAQDQY
jgi:hypothetical protein